MDIFIREAIHTDIPNLRNLNLISSSKKLLSYTENKKDLLFLDKYRENGGNFWVVISENLVIGMVGVVFKGDRVAKIRALRVHPDFRKKGIATKLMMTLERYCKDHHIKKMVLGVSEDSMSAISLYQKFEFSKYNEKTLPNGLKVYYLEKNI